MAKPLDPKNFPLRLEGDFKHAIYLLGARVDGGISQIGGTVLELGCANREIDIQDLLGKPLNVVIEPATGVKRVFPGTCVSLEFLGTPNGPAHYRAVLKPWLWFLGRTRENRIFQGKSTPEILQEVLSDYGFWGDVDKRLNDTYPTREYTVQYRETDLDFISRLMEEEGIYYFFTVDGETLKLVLADSPGSHQPITDGDPVKYRKMDEYSHRMGDQVFDWSSELRAVSGQVTLLDYNFESPKAKLRSSNAIPKGTHPGKSHEQYQYPGHFRETGDGDRRARVRMEAEAIRHHHTCGAGNFPFFEVGRTFTLCDHERSVENADWMLYRVTHLMRMRPTEAPKQYADGALSGDLGTEVLGDDPYRVSFDVVPKAEQYRAPLVTPWPEIAGIHTAVVTGPAGEEIHTDKYGRVKVLFHWDRLNKADEHSSCWLRCMMPWAGKNWGMLSVPRIGQEVVVQFEEGDPDRPLVMGMLYNGENMPPWGLPDNKTQTGILTRSAKSGTDKTFNELMFEDKKGSELVRFQAERDYEQIVRNNADIKVGLDHKDKGDMALTVHRNLTETVKTGNHTFTVASGNQSIKVKKDLTETVEGNATQTITKDVTETVKMGNVERTIEMGNETLTYKMGNWDVKADLGKITMEAMQAIELKVGGSSITIDQMGVTIKGAMSVKMEGAMTVDVKSGLSTTVASDLKTEVKGLMTDVKGNAVLILKGGITMIN